MKLLSFLALPLMVSATLGQGTDPGIIGKSGAGPYWHRATKKECAAETRREQEVWAKHGIEGDVPITMGFGDYNGNRAKWMEPCGYTNGKEFKARYVVKQNGKPEREVTKEEFEKIP